MSGLPAVDGDGSFWALLAICGFLCAIWWASKLSRLLGVSSILLEIATGVALGPRVLGLLSAEYVQCEHLRHSDCSPPPDVRQRLAQGLSLGPYLDYVSRAHRCDAIAYGALPGNLSAGFGRSEGGSQTSTSPEVTTTALQTGNILLATTTLRIAPSLESTTSTWQASVVAPTTVVVTTPPSSTTTPATPGASTTGTATTTDGSVLGLDLGWMAAEANATEDANATEAGDNESLGVGADDSDASNAVQQAHTGSSSSPAAVGGRALEGGSGDLEFASYEECLEKSCEAEVRRRCDGTPSIFTLVGRAGVALMIFESGMHFDFAMAKDVGTSACAVAVVGTILPLALGSALVAAFGKPFIPDGIAAGTALAPTSVGITLRLLGEAGVLQESFGQVIITAAFADDVLSLVMFSVLMSIGGEFDAVATVAAPFLGVVFMLVAVILAVTFWPRFVADCLLPLAPASRHDVADHRYCSRMRLTRDEILFFLMLALLVIYALITHFLGTHLWGCFLAGMSFACLQPLGRARDIWVKQTKRITTWMIRIFFACTVAFTIPVGSFLSFDAFIKGTILGLFACILTKVCCALWMEARWVIGWAMVGRAEFAYLIAQMAASTNRMDKETFSIVIWALLYATVSAPFVFRYLLDGYIKRHGLEDLAAKAEPISDSEWEEEEHEQREKHVASKEVHDGAEPDHRMRDLEGIRVDECNLDREMLAESRGKCLDKEAPDGAPGLQEMVDAKHYASTTKVSQDGKKRRDKRSRRGRTRSGKHVIYSGANVRSTRGMLCCLFFRKVVIE